MPKEYTDIKAKQLEKGKSKEEAESYAAAVYNSKIAPHKKDSRPVGNKAQQEAGSAVSEEYTLQRSIIVERNGQIEVLPKGTRIVIETYDDSYLEVRNPNGSHREARKPLKKPVPKPAEDETTADTAAKAESANPDTKRQ